MATELTIGAKPQAVFLDLIDAFKRAGFDSPIIYGGAIRDQILGIPHDDIDVRVYMDINNDIGAEGTLSSRLIQNGGFSDIQSCTLSVLGSTDLRLRLKGIFRRHVVDVVAENIKPSVSNIIQISDAPLNAVAIDPEKFCIQAHNQFFVHVQNRLYKPLMPDGFIQRYNHLKKKIDGLSLVLN